MSNMCTMPCLPTSIETTSRSRVLPKQTWWKSEAAINVDALTEFDHVEKAEGRCIIWLIFGKFSIEVFEVLCDFNWVMWNGILLFTSPKLL
ncbi:hypothetical protein QYF36_009174 [Acer negundo]|nr:hypothetical protein QYF36_009174 [Acer negundo]